MAIAVKREGWRFSPLLLFFFFFCFFFCFVFLAFSHVLCQRLPSFRSAAAAFLPEAKSWLPAGGSDEFVSSADSRSWAIVTSRQSKRANPRRFKKMAALTLFLSLLQGYFSSFDYLHGLSFG